MVSFGLVVFVGFCYVAVLLLVVAVVVVWFCLVLKLHVVPTSAK